MSAAKRVIVFDDPRYQPEDGPHMEFRLTYAGPLYATQKDPVDGQPDKRRDHKHEIREAFHPQLRRLWNITPFLASGRGAFPEALWGSSSKDIRDAASLAKRYALWNWNFVPLVTEDLALLCGLDILFLRPAVPGNLIQSGDIDNRLKTLFDALRIPVAGEEYVNRPPTPDQQPFYCLLEEDRLITKLSVETDQLLEPVDSGFDVNAVRLVITVRIRPFEMHVKNVQFG